MIVKIIYRDTGCNSEVFFEGERIYKDYHISIEDRKKNKGLEFIGDKKIPMIRIMICEKDEIKQIIYTNEIVYLLNNNGKTIERLS